MNRDVHRDVRGYLERIRFRNDADGYLIVDIRLDGSAINANLPMRPDAVLTCAGYGLPTTRDVPYVITGRLAESRRGLRLQAQKAVADPGVTPLSLMGWLLSFPGMGRATAGKVIGHFREATFEVVSKTPERLAEVPGVSTAKASQIAEAVLNQKTMQEVLEALLPFGGTPKQARRAIAALGHTVLTVIRDHPYRLLSVRGFSFPFVDGIARKNGVSPEDPERIKAAVVYLAARAETSGSTCLVREELYDLLVSLLADPPVPARVMAEAAEAAVAEKKIRLLRHPETGQYVIQSADAFLAEQRIGKRLALLSACAGTFRMSPAIDWEGLSEEQAAAVCRAMESRVLIITGGPGRGKTTIEKAICQTFEKENPAESIVLLAPTGKAARQMAAATGRDAQTIDSALGMDGERGICTGTKALKAGLVIVDEVSMVDVWHMDALLSALPDKAKLVLIGDEDQLPSVGTGAVLRDIIASGVIPLIRLTKNFRQGDGSVIADNADAINEGKRQLKLAESFQAVASGKMSQADAAAILQKLYLQEAQRVGRENVKCLLPMHKGEAGTDAMNAALQQAANPKKQGQAEITNGREKFRVGDPVMHLRNNRDLGVVNGDVGTVKAIPGDGSMVVDYYGRAITYAGEDLEDVTLNYCSTIHKSQGSEYASVITCFLEDHSIMLARNLLYTAVTRARQKVVIVGETQALSRAISHVSQNTRLTMLGGWLTFFMAKIRAMEGNPFLEEGNT